MVVLNINDVQIGHYSVAWITDKYNQLEVSSYFSSYPLIN